MRLTTKIKVQESTIKKKVLQKIKKNITLRRQRLHEVTEQFHEVTNNERA